MTPTVDFCGSLEDLPPVASPLMEAGAEALCETQTALLAPTATLSLAEVIALCPPTATQTGDDARAEAPKPLACAVASILAMSDADAQTSMTAPWSPAAAVLDPSDVLPTAWHVGDDSSSGDEAPGSDASGAVGPTAAVSAVAAALVTLALL